MRSFFKSYWKTLLFFALAGLVGGFCTGLYLLDSYPEEIVQQVLEQGLDGMTLAAQTAVQYMGYGVVLGAVGIHLGKKVGLWKDERTLAAKPLLMATAVAALGGLLLILPDVLYFGVHSPAIAASYATKPTLTFLVGAVILGGVTEEVMLRLFMLSLVAWGLHKLFGKGRETPSVAILMAANVVAALLFAAGHLPVNQMLFGLTPMIVLRCMLLNGGFGLLFGWLYRKYGLRYAMLAHGGCHVVSKVIWILFI